MSPTIPNEVAQGAHLEEAYKAVKALVEFAYEQGFHEMGYRPEEVLYKAALTKAEAVGEVYERPEGGLGVKMRKGLKRDDFPLGTKLYAHAPPDDPARYFADGPQGSFYTDDPKLARAILDAYDEGQDWTLTDLSDLTGESPAVPVESLGRDADDRDPSVFEQWYIENSPAYEKNPIGTRQCWLMRKAWNAACYAHASKSAEPVASVPDGWLLGWARAAEIEKTQRHRSKREGSALAVFVHAEKNETYSVPVYASSTNQEGAAP